MPVPVMVTEAADVVIVPDLVVFGHAVALQFPEAMALMAETSKVIADNKMTSTTKRKQCRIDFILIFKFVSGFPGVNVEGRGKKSVACLDGTMKFKSNY